MKEIKLTQGYVALVDDEDYERCMAGPKWCASVSHRTVYAVRNIRKADGTRRLQFLHCFLMGIKGADHEDHNGLNCQRYNLRPATNEQNQHNQRLSVANSSGYKGVDWRVRDQKWRARIGVEGKCIHLGLFSNPLAAAWAYDVAAEKYHGEFAYTNGDIATAAIEMAACA
jgi:hypothetical protein